jgi:hypothetical protein
VHCWTVTSKPYKYTYGIEGSWPTLTAEGCDVVILRASAAERNICLLAGGGGLDGCLGFEPRMSWRNVTIIDCNDCDQF